MRIGTDTEVAVGVSVYLLLCRFFPHHESQVAEAVHDVLSEPSTPQPYGYDRSHEFGEEEKEAEVYSKVQPAH